MGQGINTKVWVLVEMLSGDGSVLVHHGVYGTGHQYSIYCSCREMVQYCCVEMGQGEGMSMVQYWYITVV